ncbi:hypothetical protein HanXRQr2_Chr17g0816981 [Helianthus annuus]|uniref:Uncharacterized protein n=1 Tax=Helianthus annuus TaxID=4232 RepID=A0A9K3GW93_HELAN|nr:hypothetical protein HanXRQr2_Chr17g0816981 [Helianthus annuus]
MVNGKRSPLGQALPDNTRGEQGLFAQTLSSQKSRNWKDKSVPNRKPS